MFRRLDGILHGRYLLFCGTCYYPCGGWEDFHGRYRSEQKAVEMAEALQERWKSFHEGEPSLSSDDDFWYQVVDVQTLAQCRNNNE